MSSLVSKVPKCKTTGNKALDNRHEIQRQHLIEGINLLDHFADMRGDLVANMRTMISGREKSSKDDPNLFDDLSTLGRLDEKWVAGFLTAALGTDPDTIARCKSYDSDGLKHILCFLTAAGPLCQVPSECKEKQVLFRVLKKRMEEVCGRANLLKEEGRTFFKPSGALNWKLGVYKLHFGENKLLTAIDHRPTATSMALEGGIGVDDSFELVNNWSDMSAEIAKPGCKARRFKLRDFFAKGAGPNSLAYWSGKAKQFQVMAEEVVQEMELQKAAGSLSQQSEDRVAQALAEQAKRKRELATEKARVALSKRFGDNEKKRRFSLKAQPSDEQPRRTA